MATDSLTKLKLSIWRDFVPSKSLVLRRGADDGHQLLDAGSDLQQEVYSWQVKEDPFSGISNEEERLRLRVLLVDKFEASRPPAERRIEVLREFIDAAEKSISSGAAEWTISQDAPDEDEETPYRLNPLLALKLHLEWLAASFGGQPGVSVSIR